MEKVNADFLHGKYNIKYNIWQKENCNTEKIHGENNSLENDKKKIRCNFVCLFFFLLYWFSLFS